MTETRTKNELVSVFNSRVMKLIKAVELKATSPELESNLYRLRKRISLAKSSLGDDIVISSSAGILVGYFDKIMSRDEDFFMRLDEKSEVQRLKSSKSNANDDMIYDLIANMRIIYSVSPQAEKDYFYEIVKEMLSCSVEYLL